MIGQDIGNYRITGNIGAGGMGEVYLAEHVLIGRKAAIKVLLPEYSGNKMIVSRFFNEAKAAAAIKSHGIVEIYDFGFHHDGSAYIVMEYLDGEPLNARLSRLGVMHVMQALHITRQLASALDAAHQQGIVHRDLKPENIFIVPDREVAGGERIKILDFGIAKLTNQEPGSGEKTRTGVILGTPTYMAPEQCKGESTIDHRADLYAIGCILFRMLCGRPPFVATGEGAGEVLAKHILTPPPMPTSVQPSLPHLVDGLVASLLAKNPAERLQSTGELIAALDGVAAAIATAPGGGHLAAPMAGYRPDSIPPVQTTLAGGAVALSHGGAPPRRSVLVPVFSAVVVLALFGGGYALFAGGDAPAAEPAAISASAAEPGDQAVENSDSAEDEVVEAAAVVEPEPVFDAAPALVQVRIESEPAGAAVYRDDEKLGEAPLAVEVEPGAEHTYSLRLRGYRDAAVTVGADSARSGPVRVVLEPVKRETGAGVTRPKKPTTSKPKKRPDRDGVLDW